MKTKKQSGNFFTTTAVIGVIIMLIAILGQCSGDTSNSSISDVKEYRCYYCGKVIVSDGIPIHCTHEFNVTYKCDYCGKKNKVK